jgi:hypothetical protein|tara:strand:+ start:6765 stop:7898 length:1134 start_codon:yes stop_codon:yes gene_type:complete
MKDIENMIENLVEKVLKEEVNKKINNITETVSTELDEMEEYYEVAKNRKHDREANKEESNENMGKMPEDRSEFDGRDSEVVGVYSNINKQRREMGEDEVEEGNEFSGARAKAIENGEKEFTVDGKTYPVEGESKEMTTSGSSGAFSAPLGENKSKKGKHTLKLTEEEMIELIERIVKEQKIEGISSESKAMKTTKKDNEDYIKDVTKKMKKYLKDADEGEYVADPKEFPKGNGDRKDDKMMYTASDGVEEYIDQIARSGGMENLDYDQIKPDEEWLDMNILGSSDTGNNPEWANAVKTDTGEKVKDRMDKNILAKLKKQSYNKAPQPVTDYAGKKKNSEKFAGIEVAESVKTDKKKVKVNEDINKIKKLFSHNYKTQ